MRAHVIDETGKSAIVSALMSARHQMASGTSQDGYVKQLAASRWMFYVTKNGDQVLETTDLDDAIRRYNEI
jgi:hypothetical protein